MKIIAWDIKTAVATAVYYVAILVLLVFTGVVVFKLIFYPPCSPTVTGCVVDGWSIAGLAAMVLGVAATLLAILGAVAVAAWWTNLNKRVDKRVDKQVSSKINQLLDEAAKKIREENAVLFANQQKQLEITTEQTHHELEELEKQVNGFGFVCDVRAENMQKNMILLAMKHEPWIMEEWAEGVLLQNPGSEVAIRMMQSYMKIVKGLIADNDPTRTKWVEYLNHHFAPGITYEYYWKLTLKWRDRVYSQGNKSYMDTAKHQTDQLNLIVMIFQSEQDEKD